MSSYVSHTPQERKEMLEKLGLTDVDQLFDRIPRELRAEALKIEDGLSLMQTERIMNGLASKNRTFACVLRGQGSYDRYIPPLVRRMPTRESFLTSYTPYQAEVSQGTLQSIFEFQTMVSELYGLEVANASLYDGAQASAEATAMCEQRGRHVVLVSEGVLESYRQTIETYAFGRRAQVRVVPLGEDGTTNMDELATMAQADDVSCVVLQQPNAFGVIEDAKRVGEMLSDSKVAFVMVADPIASTYLASPGECGADIAVGEGQSLGLPLGFGGPNLGLLACTKAFMRKMPGRVVGLTTDSAGKRAFVLTLQAREQHIRREKATSNVCTNQALCALVAASYMACMGPEGLRDVAYQSYAKTQYLAAALEKIGFAPAYRGQSFFEVTTFVPQGVDLNQLEQDLADCEILMGQPTEVQGRPAIVWCATEKLTKQDLDMAVETISELVAQQVKEG